jgi:hypothetical protein
VIGTYYFDPSQIFVSKDRSLPYEQSLVIGSTLVGSSLAFKYHNWVEVTTVANTIAYYNMASITALKGLMVQAAGVSFIKLF